MFLHAWKLELPHPISGETLRLEAPLPKELLEALGALNIPPPGAEPVVESGRRRK
jgi:23S rRNA pseudouridine955/2504/2580 synthase